MSEQVLQKQMAEITRRLTRLEAVLAELVAHPGVSTVNAAPKAAPKLERKNERE
jgi:hypothetical protein